MKRPGDSFFWKENEAFLSSTVLCYDAAPLFLKRAVHVNFNCPACDTQNTVAMAEPMGPKSAPTTYRRCMKCLTIFLPELLAEPMTTQEWIALARPEPRGDDAWRLLAPFGKKTAVALAGRADISLIRAFLDRECAVDACDMNKEVVAKCAGQALSVKVGRPSTGALKDKYDFILCEGLLEYASDPLAELIAVRESLNPDGRVRIEAPSINGELAAQMGPDFTLFNPPAARILYTIDGLTMLAARAGFKMVSVVRKRRARAYKWLAKNQPYSSELARFIAMRLEAYMKNPSIIVLTARPD